MKKKTSLSILFLLFAGSLLAGNDYLKLNYDCKPAKGGFDNVKVIDKRLNNQLLGVVLVGGFDKTKELKFEGSLTDSIAQFFNRADTTKSTGHNLTIMLYELFASEKTEGIGSLGRIKFSFRFFVDNNDGMYRELALVDTVYIFNAMDATKKLIRSVSEHMCELAEYVSALELPSKEKLAYSYGQFEVLDSLEKLQIPIYNTTKYKRGLFSDYEHFKNNDPDGTLIAIDTTDLDRVKVYEVDTVKGKRTHITHWKFYAASDGVTLVKATTKGIYLLKKIDSDFYYDGETAFYSKVGGEGVAMALMFGMAGALATPSRTSAFHLRINYFSGHSIPIGFSGK
jgi:hypothetical protein